MRKKDDSEPKKMVVLIGIDGGGFQLEAQALLAKIGNRYDWHYVSDADSVWRVRTLGFPENKIHSITVATTLTQKNVLKRIFSVLCGIVEMFRLVRIIEPACIVCIGSSSSIALCLNGKLLGAKTIFIESMARVDGISLTGRIIDFFGLADRFYVQWPQMANERRKHIYEGMVL